MRSGYVLAIDQGTTGTKALVLDHRARVVSLATAELTQYYPHPGWVEHDPDEIWQGVLRTSRDAIDEAGIHGGDIAGIGITNQRETTVAWERATGRPLHNAIVWQDRRTAGECGRLADEGAEPFLRDATGLLLDAYFSGTKMAWLLDNVPGSRERAEAGEVALGTVDSWLVYRLTGGREHVTDATNASRTMLMDLARVDWDDELCTLLRVPRRALPDIRPSAHVHGDTDPEAFLGLSTPVAAILGDQQSALFAQGCFEPGQTKNTYGTGSFVLQHTGDRPHTGQDRLIATVAAAYEGGRVEYALEGSIFVTGAAVQWLRDELGIIREAGETEQLAASLGGNDDVWFVPALTGLGAPTWDPSARGTLLGVTRGTTRAHLARAVLESIAYQTRDVVDRMAAETGRPPAELRADGGAAVNTWLMAFQADILGVPVDVPEVTETTSLGSGFLAGLTTGVFDGREELRRLRRVAGRYEPRMSRPTRDELYRRWGEAVSRSRGWVPT